MLNEGKRIISMHYNRLNFIYIIVEESYQFRNKYLKPLTNSNSIELISPLLSSFKCEKLEFLKIFHNHFDTSFIERSHIIYFL